MTSLVADIEGYASVFNETDLNGDVVAPGAFAKSLKKGARVAMLYQHAAEAPIGRWLSFREDARGLYVKGELLLASERARDVHALIDGGAIDGLSIGYQTARSVRTAQGRRIVEADLWEVSVVTFPMAQGARVTRIGPARAEAALQDYARMFKESACAQMRANQELAAFAARVRRRADEESAACAAVAAPALSPPTRGAGARLFADALRGAAQKLSV